MLTIGWLSQDELEIEDLDLGAKSIKNSTALGCDFLEPVVVKSLTKDQKQGILNIYRKVEKQVAWPVQVLSNLIILMGKPGGGLPLCRCYTGYGPRFEGHT